MTPEECRDLIVKNKFYQSFDFRNGVSVKGYTDTNFVWKMCALDTKGKSFVDIGSHYAYYAIQSLLEGGTLSVALDRDKKRLEVASKIAEHFNVKEKFKTSSFDFNKVTNILGENKYDITWCIGLLHYIDDKERFIKEMAEKTNEVFIVEIFTNPANATSLHKHYNPNTLVWLNKYFKRLEFLGPIKKQFENRVIYKCYVR